MHPVDKRPDREALRLVAKVWARRGTGVLTSAAGRAVLVQGDPKDQAALEVVVASLYEADTRFVPKDLYAGGGRPLAPELWEAGRRRANVSGVRERLDHALVERPGAEGIGRLPLSEDTRTVLGQENSPRHTLSDLIASAKANASEVTADVAVLVALGLHKLRRAAGGGRAATSQSMPPRRPPPARPSGLQADRAIARLRREWAAIETADDYTVVGVSRQMPAEVVQRACDRMLGRYSRLARDERLPAEAQEIAGRIHQRVSDAVVRLRQGRGTSFRSTRVSSADPFTAGMGFVEQGDWTRAVKCFNMARHQDPHSGRNVAWLGWSVFNDPTLPAMKRRRKARELLELAETLDAGNPAVILLLARVEHIEGDMVRAWNRLDTLVTREPDNVEARALLVRVQKDIKQRK